MGTIASKSSNWSFCILHISTQINLYLALHLPQEEKALDELQSQFLYYTICVGWKVKTKIQIKKWPKEEDANLNNISGMILRTGREATLPLRCEKVIKNYNMDYIIIQVI